MSDDDRSSAATPGTAPGTTTGTTFTILHTELRRIDLPLVTPFRTSFGTQTARDVLLVRMALRADDGPNAGAEVEGWGECVALAEPSYSPEYVDGAQHVIVHHLLPRLAAAGSITAADVAPALAKLHGHPMAKAALEMAVLDAQLRAHGQSFADFLGAERTRIPSGVSVGIHDTTDELLAAVQGYVDDGYVRIKLKIEPGNDLEQVAAVRELIGPQTPFQVDANTAYRRTDGAHLARLDAFDLLLVEQPLPEHDIVGHARLAAEVATPICLDESLVSVEGTADAIELGACEIANIKPGRVGGYLEAVRIHDLCVERGIPVWCGGMLETGIGRAANAALAALPGFTLPGDISASSRFYERDIVTDPIALDDGHVVVPTTPGLGFELDRIALDGFTSAVVGIAGLQSPPL
jgi:O-succinylbenzoate synthase